MSDTVKLSVQNGIATIALNRPHVMNAMDGEMMSQLRPVAEAVEQDASVRAVVLRGEGPAFMAGGDVAAFHQHLAELPELIMLPDRFDAETARLHGLVNWVVPADKLVEESARIAAGPTRAFAEAKRLVNQPLEPMSAQMEQELQAFSRCAREHDLKEGVTAFVQKRKPVFTGE